MSVEAFFSGPPGKVDEDQINVSRSLKEWSQSFQVNIVEVSTLYKIGVFAVANLTLRLSHASNTWGLIW